MCRGKVRQPRADERPAHTYDVRVEPQPSARASSEPDAAELVGVLVDEADRDAVVLGDSPGRPERRPGWLWLRLVARSRGTDEVRDLRREAAGQAICQLIDEYGHQQIGRFARCFVSHRETSSAAGTEPGRHPIGSL
jgi:hypothetical protein